jgi:CRISPR/Cas system CMR-associated protein Cmr1 (group 7 of RAMP superfamily)
MRLYSQTVQSVPTSWRIYKVHLVMQPHGCEGTFRSRPLKICYKTVHEIYKWFIMICYSQTVQSVPRSWRMYKVHLVMQPHGFGGSFRFRSIKIGYDTAHEVCKWFMMMFYSQTVQSVPISWRIYKVHLVMQPHGFEGSFRSSSIKIGYKTALEVCKWLIMMFYSQTVQSVPTSWRMYIVHIVM